MGRTLSVHVLGPLLFISMCLSASTVPLDSMKRQNQTLIYHVDATHNINYFCEFATSHALSGVYEEICEMKNPKMRMIRNGEVYFPWRKYSKGIDGIILECPAHGMTNSTCSNGLRLYSVCAVSCPAGYVNTTQTIECKLRPPLTNVSAEWSYNNFCQPVIKDDPQLDTKTEDDNTDGIIVTVLSCVLVPFVIIIIAVVIGLCRNKACRNRAWPCCCSPKEISPRGSTSTNFSSIPHQEKVDDIKNEPDVGLSDLQFYTYGRRDSDQLCKEEPLQFGYRDGSADTLLDEAPSLSLVDEEDEIRGGLRASKPYRGKESFLEDKSSDDTCTALIQDFLDLKLNEIRKLTSVLEYLENHTDRKKEHTLYGYILDNWEVLGFPCKERVEVCQARPDCRGGNEPAEYFLRQLGSQGATVHEVLVYFHKQGAKSAKAILLEFHKCEFCWNKFMSH